jgi:prepilin-type N-terminal cleavage/methylation domain-containing protein
MRKPAPKRRESTGGFSVIEVLVAITIFSIVVLGVAATGAVTARNLNSGQESTSAATAVQTKVDSLASLGWAALTPQSGADSAQGHSVSWVVTGDNPRHLVVVIHRQVMSQTLADTIVTYVSK